MAGDEPCRGYLVSGELTLEPPGRVEWHRGLSPWVWTYANHLAVNGNILSHFHPANPLARSFTLSANVPPAPLSSQTVVFLFGSRPAQVAWRSIIGGYEVPYTTCILRDRSTNTPCQKSHTTMSGLNDLRRSSVIASAQKATSGTTTATTATATNTDDTHHAHYSPPWADVSIIGIAGSSGSGKTSLAVEIVQSLNLPWVIILSIDSFYKSLTPEQNAAAHRNEYDLDSPSSIDFDLLVEKLRDLKQGKRTDIPIYSFQEHQRLDRTLSIYSPHVIVLEGILALHDPRTYVCRGELFGTFVNGVGLLKAPSNSGSLLSSRSFSAMLSHRNRRPISSHNAELERLGQQIEDYTLSDNAIILAGKPQITGVSTILRNPVTSQIDFIFYFDRLAALLIEKALDCHNYVSTDVITPHGCRYSGLKSAGKVSAVVILRGGSCMETGLKRTLPDCLTGRLLIQSNLRTGEPELHYLKLFPDIDEHETVMLVDPQMPNGGAALMAVKVLVDHGVAEKRIVFVTCLAGKRGLKRLMTVFPKIKVVAANVVEDNEKRWIEERSLKVSMTATTASLLEPTSSKPEQSNILESRRKAAAKPSDTLSVYGTPPLCRCAGAFHPVIGRRYLAPHQITSRAECNIPHPCPSVGPVTPLASYISVPEAIEYARDAIDHGWPTPVGRISHRVRYICRRILVPTRRDTFSCLRLRILQSTSEYNHSSSNHAFLYYSSLTCDYGESISLSPVVLRVLPGIHQASRVEDRLHRIATRNGYGSTLKP
ncbi:uridine kinase, partial [Aureobasidium melanogenum]